MVISHSRFPRLIRSTTPSGSLHAACAARMSGVRATQAEPARPLRATAPGIRRNHLQVSRLAQSEQTIMRAHLAMLAARPRFGAEHVAHPFDAAAQIGGGYDEMIQFAATQW
jgi:hypothetical protein